MILSEACENRGPCRNCLASTGERVLPCFRLTVEARRKIERRDELAHIPEREKTAFDRECERRDERDGDLYEDFADIMKWAYSEERYSGLYRDTLLLEEIHRYELRAQRLRGTKPRPKYEVAESIGGLTARSAFAELVGIRPPFFALFPKVRLAT